MKTKIGIWGLGLVGKSVISYLSNKNYSLEVLENRDLNAQEDIFLKKYNSHFVNSNDTSNIFNFLNNNEFIIPSPGIDLTNYTQYHDKFMSELDLFYEAIKFYKNIKTLAITGTLGKTSITHMLNEILIKFKYKVSMGGNIGIPMLNILNDIDNSHIILLELSSFQLEFSKRFAPDFAIITNFYPNHLDRHKTLKNYLNAKLNIINHQNKHQKALIPFYLARKIKSKKPNSKLYFFSKEKPNKIQFDSLEESDLVYFISNDIIFKAYKLKNNIIIKKIISINNLINISYKENWLIIIATCDIYQININKLMSIKKLNIPTHRMELIAKYTTKHTNKHDIYFYNDSKSTIPESTIAAVNNLKDKSIILFLGGLSKGVNRETLIKKLKNKVKKIICFGKEAKLLNKLCNANNINSSSFNNLKEAFIYCISIIEEQSIIKSNKTYDCVLFSPSGSSFDLFKNYQDRGDKFKTLVYQFINNIN